MLINCATWRRFYLIFIVIALISCGHKRQVYEKVAFHQVQWRKMLSFRCFVIWKTRSQELRHIPLVCIPGLFVFEHSLFQACHRWKLFMFCKRWDSLTVD